MGKPILLLGAGASIDAGLLDTNRLTRQIYSILQREGSLVPVQLFGYVIAKILIKKVRLGGSPFDDVNVEEAYDGIEKLIGRDKDITSEFVSSWDPFLESLRPQFDEYKFVDRLSSAIESSYARSIRGSNAQLSIDRSRLQSAAREITNAIGAAGIIGSSDVFNHLIRALLKCLEHDQSKIEYIQKIISILNDNVSVIASLNYDLVVENGLSNQGITYNYGLDNWTDKKIVSFHSRKPGVKLLKLHGSINWSGIDDDISVIDDVRKNNSPAIVFGSNNGKLTPRGPFLQLRHEFEKRLLDTNTLIIIGYAFGDDHLNALIRRWTSTRRKARLVIIDPGPVSFESNKIGTPYLLEKGKLTKRTVEITHIQKGASEAVANLAAVIEAPINLEIPKERSGMIPHIWVNFIR